MADSQDEYGNPIRQTDEYSNPIHQTGTMGATTGSGMQGTGTGMDQHHGTAGVLHRSGSSGTSSSEDDGQGGRRKKKGLKEKIKEKIPGGRPKDENTQSTTTPGGYEAGQQHEKKGIM